MPPEVQVEAVSPFYESEPQPPAPPPRYLNAVCRVSTTLEPQALLHHLKQIERRLGRGDAERWAPRVIDLDIILFDEVVLETPELTIPHPRFAERAFVLRPLLDLDPGLTHPVTGEPLAAILKRVGTDGLTRLETPTEK
jgi:2-amino-4-hydroxy-6-hydroxymethyldihydropteridine diphosphokinase